jgi:hypothetical protein
MRKLTLLVFLAAIIVSCGDSGFKPDSTGRPGELIVVIEKAFQEKESGAAIKNIFAQSQYGLPQDEPLFTVVTIPKDAFNKVLQRHRNVLIADISPVYESPSVTLKNDVMAKGQMYVQISAPDDSTFARIVYKNRSTLLNYFEEKELDRLKASATKLSDKSHVDYIEKKHQVRVKVPKNYNLVREGENFSWFRYEVEKPSGGQRHPISRNLMIFTKEYTSQQMLELGNLMDSQDSVAKEHIAGPSKGSYMKIVPDLLPAKKEFNLNNNYAVSLRGLWYLENDFMGGPFLNYTTIDTANNQVVSIVSFIYAPNFDKREYLREMEGLMRTFELMPAKQ